MTSPDRQSHAGRADHTAAADEQDAPGCQVSSSSSMPGADSLTRWLSVEVRGTALFNGQPACRCSGGDGPRLDVIPCGLVGVISIGADPVRFFRVRRFKLLDSAVVD